MHVLLSMTLWEASLCMSPACRYVHEPIQVGMPCVHELVRDPAHGGRTGSATEAPLKGPKLGPLTAAQKQRDATTGERGRGSERDETGVRERRRKNELSLDGGQRREKKEGKEKEKKGK